MSMPGAHTRTRPATKQQRVVSSIIRSDDSKTRGNLEEISRPIRIDTERGRERERVRTEERIHISPAPNARVELVDQRLLVFGEAAVLYVRAQVIYPAQAAALTASLQT